MSPDRGQSLSPKVTVSHVKKLAGARVEGTLRCPFSDRLCPLSEDGYLTPLLGSKS